MGRRNGYWPTHPVKELQEVLIELDENGWRVEKGKGYYKTYCPCSEKHKKTVHLSPSNPNYRRDLVNWLSRQPCYNGPRKGRA
jgi:hypothetical protein